MNPFSRREFLQRSAILAAVAGTTTIAAADEPMKAGAANDKLRVAVVGVRSRGKSHIGGFAGKNNCEVVTICDCDEAMFTGAMNDKDVKAAIAKQGSTPKYEKDFRKLLDDKSIDIISVATPNHWHALMAVWAMRAGKDVYCEKPATHNLHEGRLMTQAARKYNRLCQVGTQSRSNAGLRDAIAYIHAGKIGAVSLAYGLCFKSRKSIGQVTAATEPPKSMDYDLWTGPAHLLPVKRKSLHYDWHWVWEYGNGDFGNQGVHEADKARWGMQVGLPQSVVSVGGRFGYSDDGETPNTQLNLFEYPGGKNILFEVRGLNTCPYRGMKVGNIWFGETGIVATSPRSGYTGAAAFDFDGNKIKEFRGGSDQQHFDNFVKAVRSRKPGDLHCDVEEGHISAALCHLGNISYRLGQPGLLGDDIRTFEKLDTANQAFGRMKAHVADHAVEAAKARCYIGAKLAFDPTTEKITAAAEKLSTANDMLFREYRKGFDITQAV